MLQKYRTETAKTGGTKLPQKALDYIGAVETFETEESETEAKFSESSLSPAQYRKFREGYESRYRPVADAVERSPAWPVMENDARNKVLSLASRLSKEAALEESSGGQYVMDTGWMRWATGGAEYGVTEDMAVLFKAAYDSTESEKDKAGKTVAGSRKKKTLALAKEWMPDMDRRQLRYLQSFYWEPYNAKLKAWKENGYRAVGKQ